MTTLGEVLQAIEEARVAFAPEALALMSPEEIAAATVAVQRIAAEFERLTADVELARAEPASAAVN